MENVECELDQKIWALIGATKVYLLDLTYADACKWQRRAIEANHKLANELAIATSIAARRFTQKEKAAN